ncbi:uncharacterized protein PG986_004747 [Apiospora aurea]|uniref:Mid2 domain-containing protein n=1 Tax=Apiospora aurea TaxID=335848 RepID=A0ABR1QNG0_9PEZI
MANLGTLPSPFFLSADCSQQIARTYYASSIYLLQGPPITFSGFTIVNNGATTVTPITASGGGINAYGVQLRYNAAALQSSTSSSSASPSSISSSSSAPTATDAAASSSGLSSGAAAGIGIGCAVGGIAILAAVVFLFLRGRRRQQQQPQQPYQGGPPTAHSSMMQQQQPIGDPHVMKSAGGYRNSHASISTYPQYSEQPVQEIGTTERQVQEMSG